MRFLCKNSYKSPTHFLGAFPQKSQSPFRGGPTISLKLGPSPWKEWGLHCPLFFSDMTNWWQARAGGGVLSAVTCGVLARKEAPVSGVPLWFSFQHPQLLALRCRLLSPVGNALPVAHRPVTDSRLFSPPGLQAALETLLLRKPVRLKCHPLANYHYAGRLPGAL